MTFIPLRYMPVDAVKVTDPVTGATYMRPRRFEKKKKDPDAGLQGYAKPKTCDTPYCKKAGLPHDECEKYDLSYANYFNPYYTFPGYTYPVYNAMVNQPFVPPRPDDIAASPAHSAIYPFIPPRPDNIDSPPARASQPRECAFIPPRPEDIGATPAWRWVQARRRAANNASPVVPPTNSNAELEGFQRWQQTFPHWQLPRECPPNWQDYLPRDEGRYTRHRAAQVLPQQQQQQQQQANPLYYTPQNSNPYVAGTSPWPPIAGLPPRPTRVQWDMYDGTFEWKPRRWVPHPVPHPNVPAQAFWNYPYGMPAWTGPGGWTYYSGMDPNVLTGGHPLPGTNAAWTPDAWPAPQQPPSNTVTLSGWLAPSPRNAYVPHILWDAAVEPPYAIRRLSSRGYIVPFATTGAFRDQATTPAVRSLLVNLPRMRSSWGPVRINKDSHITVGDVLTAVWEYLQMPISRQDYDAYIRRHPNHANQLHWVFHRRCKTSGALADYTKRQGIRRVDFMEGETIYWGTYLTYDTDGTWSLTMAFVPRTHAAN